MSTAKIPARIENPFPDVPNTNVRAITGFMTVKQFRDLLAEFPDDAVIQQWEPFMDYGGGGTEQRAIVNLELLDGKILMFETNANAKPPAYNKD